MFRGNVKNNVGFLLFKLGRFRVARDYLTEARRLAVNAKDKILESCWRDFAKPNKRNSLFSERLNWRTTRALSARQGWPPSR